MAPVKPDPIPDPLTDPGVVAAAKKLEEIDSKRHKLQEEVDELAARLPTPEQEIRLKGEAIFKGLKYENNLARRFGRATAELAELECAQSFALNAYQEFRSLAVKKQIEATAVIVKQLQIQIIERLTEVAKLNVRKDALLGKLLGSYADKIRVLTFHDNLFSIKREDDQLAYLIREAIAYGVLSGKEPFLNGVPF